MYLFRSCQERLLLHARCMHEYAVYNATEGDSALRHQLRIDGLVEWAAQSCSSARTFIDSVKSVQAVPPAATEVTLDNYGSNAATSRSRPERNQAHAHSSTSTHLQPWAWRVAIDHFWPPTPLTALKVYEPCVYYIPAPFTSRNAPVDVL